MKWSLRDETIGCWYTQDTGNAGSYAEEEDVPMETSGLLQGKFTALANEAGDIVVEVEEDR